MTDICPVLLHMHVCNQINSLEKLPKGTSTLRVTVSTEVRKKACSTCTHHQ